MNKLELRECCSIERQSHHEHMPSWANLKSVTKRGYNTKDECFQGPGIYACFWDDELIYIGSHAPQDEHVIQRAHKHIVGFTLRSSVLFFRKSVLNSIIAKLPSPIASDLNKARSLGDRIREEGRKGIPSSNKGLNGSFCATEAKANFAAQHWDVIKDADAEELFDHFTFFYERVDLTEDCSIKVAKKELEAIESSLIGHFNPICNTRSRTGPVGPVANVADVRAQLNMGALLMSEDISVKGQTALSALPVPNDRLWETYKTESQFRVRAVKNGRVLLVRTSKDEFHCLADKGALGLQQLNPEDAGDNVGMNTKIKFDPDAPSEEIKKIVKAALKASLNYLGES